MSKKFKKVTVTYPVEDVVTAELLLEVDSNIDDKELQRLVEKSDLEYFEEDSGIEFHGIEIVDRDYATDFTNDWQQRIAVNEMEDISNEEWGEYYVA